MNSVKEFFDQKPLDPRNAIEVARKINRLTADNIYIKDPIVRKINS